MIHAIKNYYVDNNEVISDDDIREAIKIANESNETIRVVWSGPGWPWYPNEKNGYELIVKPGSNFDELKEKTPKIYGV